MKYPNSEVSKMAFYAILVRLDPIQSCLKLKVADNLRLKAKMFASKQVAVIFTEKSKFFATLQQLWTVSRRTKTA